MIEKPVRKRPGALLRSASEEETEAIGARLASLLDAGAFVALRGDLGAGKTAFVRGFAAALGDDCASSPTFGIVHEYDTVPQVFHFDVYRLRDESDLDAIGYDDYLRRGGILLMEWPERVEALLPPDRLELRIDRVSDGERRIAIDGFGACADLPERMGNA